MDLPQNMVDDAKNQTVVNLYISEDERDIDRKEEFRARVEEFVYNYLQGNNGPTGATFKDHSAWWQDDDGDDHYEIGKIIEIWVDDRTEIEIIRDLKNALENNFDQYCVCMRISEEIFIH